MGISPPSQGNFICFPLKKAHFFTPPLLLTTSLRNSWVLRHMALNLLKQEHTAKCGIKARRLKADWNEDYLRKVLAA